MKGHREKSPRNGSRPERLLIIGVDGASYDLVRAWIEKGELKTLGRLKEEGAFGLLRSTNPPVTFPAVPSFITGKGPGGHGISSFFRPNTDGLLGLVDSTKMDGEFWNIGTLRDKKKIIVNLPLTYPAKKVNGWVVADALTPSKQDPGFLYPASLREELGGLLDAYEIDADMAYLPGMERKYLNACKNVMSARIALTRHLMRTKDWDITILFLTILDRLQHFLFGRDGNSWLLEGYKHVDEAIGELIKNEGSGTHVLVFSDHGFGRSKGRFYPNSWLERNGFLHFKRSRSSGDKATGLRAMKKRLVPNIRSLQFNDAVCWLCARVPNAIIKKGVTIIEGMQDAYDLHAVDMTQTKAYATINGIYVNAKSKKERQRTTDEVIRGLQGLEHPATGARLHVHVSLKEYVYHGRYLDKMPDILYSIEGYSFEPFASFEPQEPIQVFGRMARGWHREEGILFACGPNFKHQILEGARIEDIAPTILRFFGQPRPKDMDGRALTGLFIDGPGAVLGHGPNTDPDAQDPERTKVANAARCLAQKRRL